VLILVQPDGQLRRTSAGPGQLVPAQRGGPVRMAERIAEQVLGAADTAVVARLTQQDWLRLVPNSTLRADVCLAVARSKPDRPPVVLAVAQAGVPGAEEMQIQRQLTLSVALTVEALHSYAEEHLIAMTLQRSFLPSALPEIPGLSMSARYIPASDQAEIGGDFYEAVTWQDKLLIAIGDVQGHSLHAATVMGEIRHALRAFAIEGHPPLAITGLVNDVLQTYHPNVIATLCLAVLDPVTGELELFNCGHIPALIVEGDAATYFGQGGLMLGLPVHQAHVERTVLPPGATVLLLTDGLVEDRRYFLDETMEKLRLAAEDASGTELEAFSNNLMSLFGPREDDVAMIAVRRSTS
jgi:Stage II sporulation protein E (SpoIIE)